MERLGEDIGGLVGAHGGGGDLVICSTTVTDLLYNREDLNSLFRAAVQRQCGMAVDQIISTYECASWGYALRSLSRHGGGGGRATVLAMDANLPHFEFWARDQVWGRSGHGTLVLSVDLKPGFEDDLVIGCAKPGQGLHAFARAVQKAAGTWENLRVFVPFLTPEMCPVLDRLPARKRVGSNLYETYGHCFGSDPRIGLGERKKSSPDDPVRDAVVGSFALNGCYCLARLTHQANGTEP